MSATARPCTRDFFALVDTMDVATISALFAEDAQVAFGNSQPFVGIEQIRTGLSAVFDTIAGLRHDVVNEWSVGDDTIVEFKITYDRKDGRQVTIPCVTIVHVDAAGKIDAYRVYFDVAPIHA